MRRIACKAACCNKLALFYIRKSGWYGPRRLFVRLSARQPGQCRLGTGRICNERRCISLVHACLIHARNDSLDTFIVTHAPGIGGMGLGPAERRALAGAAGPPIVPSPPAASWEPSLCNGRRVLRTGCARGQR